MPFTPGAVVIEPRQTDPVESDREYVVLLSDWTGANPETVYSNLKQRQTRRNALDSRRSVVAEITDRSLVHNL
jgi:FtsP/CotA-like multicopper oxidase with cupredoxin domain